MKKLTCEICSGTEFVKQDGIFACQSCGTKYSVEDVRKMVSEIDGTSNDITKSEKSLTQKIDSYYRLAEMNISIDSNKTLEYCDKILEIDSDYYGDWKLKSHVEFSRYFTLYEFSGDYKLIIKNVNSIYVAHKYADTALVCANDSEKKDMGNFFVLVSDALFSSLEGSVNHSNLIELFWWKLSDMQRNVQPLLFKTVLSSFDNEVLEFFMEKYAKRACDFIDFVMNLDLSKFPYSDIKRNVISRSEHCSEFIKNLLNYYSADIPNVSSRERLIEKHTLLTSTRHHANSFNTIQSQAPKTKEQINERMNQLETEIKQETEKSKSLEAVINRRKPNAKKFLITSIVGFVVCGGLEVLLTALLASDSIAAGIAMVAIAPFLLIVFPVLLFYGYSTAPPRPSENLNFLWSIIIFLQ